MKGRELVKEQVDNCDERGLNWDTLPQKILSIARANFAPEFKMWRDRITVVMCINANGAYRFPVAVIGESKELRACKNLNLNVLPVSYYPCGSTKIFLGTGSTKRCSLM